MPEYLAPGVFVEEVSFRNKSIEGVSTSTAGFVGPTRFGPESGEPELLTSFADFERIYGGLEPLQFGGTEITNYLAHAVRAFFDEGGRRLYVTRAYDVGTPTAPAAPDGRARWDHPDSPEQSDLEIIARHPGRGGNRTLLLEFELGEEALVAATPARLVGVRRFDVVLARLTSTGNSELYWVFRTDDQQILLRRDASSAPVDPTSTEQHAIADFNSVRRLSVSVTAQPLGRFDSAQEWNELGFHNEQPGAGIPPSLTTVFPPRPAPRRRTTLYVPIVFRTSERNPAQLAHELVSLQPMEPNIDGSPATIASIADGLLRADAAPEHQTLRVVLENGHDGDRPELGSYEPALAEFEDLENISIVAAPGSTFGRPDPGEFFAALITHCELMRYRVAVLDTPEGLLPPQALALKGRFDSTRAALYYPWVWTYDPIREREFLAPPSGPVAGIYARTDIERGVHKSPANEVIRQALGFESLINKGQQEVLNPKGVNCLRFFEGRGYRVWGARTMSSDPEWKYLNVRRYFLWLERSIEIGTQWAVFENNGPLLWKNVRTTIEDFLFNEFKSNHLLGDKPDEAFFVRCDRTTMTQNDLDNGRLVCLIGVSPLRPAEFVIFRIGQKTLDARR